MFPSYAGKKLIITDAAMRELFQYGYDQYDVIDILEEGYDCSRSKREEHIIERCIDRKRKTLKVVISRSYNHFLDSEVWVIIHFGIKTKRR